MRLLVILILVCSSCRKALPDKEVLIDRFYAEKVHELKMEQEAICREALINEVKVKIDSLIDTWVNAELVDTIAFPSRPVKPIRPENILDKFERFSLDSLPFGGQ